MIHGYNCTLNTSTSHSRTLPLTLKTLTQYEILSNSCTSFLIYFLILLPAFHLSLINYQSWLYQVDNGVIDHLLPSLHNNDWDVLIAHFLGVVSYYGFSFGLPCPFSSFSLLSWKLVRSTLFRTMQGIYLVLTQPRWSRSWSNTIRSWRSVRSCI